MGYRDTNRNQRIHQIVASAGMVALFAMLTLTACSSSSGPQSGTNTKPRIEPTLEPKPADPRTRARIRTDLAAAYYETGNLAVAVEEIRIALAADPTYATAHGINGLIQMELRDNTQAQLAFERGLQLAPNDPDINHNYGWFLCQSGREADSLKYFAAAIRDPLYQSPGRSMGTWGLCLQRLNRQAEALGQFEAALRLDPNYVPIMLPLARLRFERDAFEPARALVARHADLVGPTAEGLWIALLIERRFGDVRAAESFGAQLQRRFPESREAQSLAQGRFE